MRPFRKKTSPGRPKRSSTAAPTDQFTLMKKQKATDPSMFDYTSHPLSRSSLSQRKSARTLDLVPRRGHHFRASFALGSSRDMKPSRGVIAVHKQISGRGGSGGVDSRRDFQGMNVTDGRRQETNQSTPSYGCPYLVAWHVGLERSQSLLQALKGRACLNGL